MTRKYAQDTTVPADKSQAEIIAYIKGRGADKVATFEDGDGSVIMFEFKGKAVRFKVLRPDLSEFNYDSAGRFRNQTARERAADQEWMRRWRVLLITIKSKFEMIDSGLVGGFNEEFLPYLVTRTGNTVYEELAPTLEDGSTFVALPPMFAGALPAAR